MIYDLFVSCHLFGLLDCKSHEDKNLSLSLTAVSPELSIYCREGRVSRPPQVHHDGMLWPMRWKRLKMRKEDNQRHRPKLRDGCVVLLSHGSTRILNSPMSKMKKKKENHMPLLWCYHIVSSTCGIQNLLRVPNLESPSILPLLLRHKELVFDSNPSLKKSMGKKETDLKLPDAPTCKEDT